MFVNRTKQMIITNPKGSILNLFLLIIEPLKRAL